jgi:hypothetical protein
MTGRYDKIDLPVSQIRAILNPIQRCCDLGTTRNCAVARIGSEDSLTEDLLELVESDGKCAFYRDRSPCLARRFQWHQRALSYMAGEDVYTRQVSRVIGEARPVILAKYPLVAKVIVPDEIDESTVEEWLKEQAKPYGEFLALPRLTIDQQGRVDPVSEAVENKHPNKVEIIRARHRAH